MAGFRNRIARWIDDGTPFELIAERIGRLSASEEEKSALWVWARLHGTDRGRRHGLARRRVLAD
jgi:hypothetical protein